MLAKWAAKAPRSGRSRTLASRPPDVYRRRQPRSNRRLQSAPLAIRRPPARFSPHARARLLVKRMIAAVAAAQREAISRAGRRRRHPPPLAATRRHTPPLAATRRLLLQKSPLVASDVSHHERIVVRRPNRLAALGCAPPAAPESAFSRSSPLPLERRFVCA